MNINKKEWVFVYSEGHSMLMNEIFFSSFTDFPDIPGMLDTVLYINKGGSQTCYTTPEVLKKVREEGKIFFNSKYRQQFKKNIDKCYDEFYSFFEQYKKLNLYTFSNKELLDLFDKYVSHLSLMCAYYQVSGGRVYLELEEYVKKTMSKYFTRDKLDEAYTVMLMPDRLDEVQKEELNLIKIAEKNEVDDNILRDHAQKYSFLFFNIYYEEKIFDSLKERIKKIKKKEESAQKYIKESESKCKHTKRIQKNLANIIGKEDQLLDLIEFLREQGMLRFYYKGLFFGVEYKFLNLFKEIARRIELSIDKYMLTYRIEDTRKFLLEGKKLSSKYIKERKSIFIFLQENGEKYFLSGNSAKKKEQEFFDDKTEEISELKGVVANRGKAIGRAKVILTDSFEQIEKGMSYFKDGEILITTMTQPNFLPIMKKASAILTNQGGIICHAAVLSRELGIPCIIQLYKATKVFKDGDMIEVDAEQGIVRKI